MLAKCELVQDSAFRGAQLLVVDDEEVNRKIMLALLSQKGLCVTTASSGSEAIAVTKRRKFCSILIDIDMPEMNGFETAQYIRRTRGKSSKSFIIGMSVEARQDEVRSGGPDIDAFVGKPVSIKEILKVIFGAIKN
jgi:two-component system sensor histidine kinase/response regulator